MEKWLPPKTTRTILNQSPFDGLLLRAEAMSITDQYHEIPLEIPPLKRPHGVVGRGIVSSFYAGEENREVAELADPFAILGLVDRSPLILFGDTATGKTALAMSLAFRWCIAADQGPALQINGVDFARQFQSAIESDDMDRFRERHRDCRCLLIDDLHELAGRDAAQEELVHTLDALADQQAVVIATTALVPSTMRDFRRSLVSRLMSGLQVHVQPPGLWARQKIIMALAESLQMELGEEECQRIASGVPDGVTAMQLRGILLQWMQQQHREPQDRDQTLQAMLLQQHRSHTPSLDLIAKAAARSLGVRLSEMRGNTKRSQIVRARGLAILMARRWTELSLQQIGDYFGGRDHTTILHAFRKTEADLQGDVELQRAAEEMRQRVRG